MENYVFKKVCTKEKIFLRLHLKILKNAIEIIIFEHENAWKATVAKADLESFINNHKTTFENYCEQLLEYIRDSPPNIVYIFGNNEFIIERLLQESLKVKYFTCNLKKVDYVENVEQIMDKFYLENLKLAENVHILKKENEEVTKYKDDCESKLKLLIDKKICDENEQMGQFMLILNEKKLRIQHLTELLEAFKGGRSTVNPQVKIINKKRKSDNGNTLPVPKRETVSDSESSVSNESNYNSDDENTGSTNSKTSIEKCEPSTSSALDFLEDDFEEKHVLPKRLKRNDPENVIVISSGSKTPPKSPVEEDTTEKRKSPTIDLSTQQLLDLL